MTMCAAITVPILKDGYRLYPGMPVSSGTGGGRGSTSSNSQSINSINRSHRSVCGSPPECGSMTPMATSPPNGQYRPSGIIVGGAMGAGVHHQVIPIQSRSSTTRQISARSSFEVGPTAMNADPTTSRTAMSTSQLYIQKRRELCIQQQLQKQQEMARRLQQEQQQRQSDNNSISKSSRSIDRALDERKRKTSTSVGGDPNNNSESSNPFRKLMRRLGFGGGGSNRHLVHRSISECESGIEQATVASEAVAVTAWH